MAGPDDVYLDHLARNYAIRWACRVDNEDCQSDAAEIMAEHYQTGARIDKNIADVISCAGFRTMNETDFDIVFDQLDLSVESPATRTQAIDTLCCTYNPEFIYKILNRTLEEDSWFLASERVYIIQKLATRDYQSMQITLEFLKENIDTLKALEIPEFDIRATFYQMASSSYSYKYSPTITEYAVACDIAIDTAIIDTMQTKNLEWMAQQGDVIIKFLTTPKEEEGEPDGANSIVVSSFLVVVALVMSFFRV